MKGHVGDGARSGELKAPVTGPIKPTPHPARAPRLRMGDACSFVSITFDSAGIGSLKLGSRRLAELAPCLFES